MGLRLQRVSTLSIEEPAEANFKVNLATRAVHLKSQDHLAAAETLATTTLDPALAQARLLKKRTPA